VSADVVVGAKRGNRNDQETLLRAYAGFVRGMLVKLMGRSSDLEDAHQEVMLKILRGLGSYRAESALSTWVAGICVHTASNYFRSRQRLAREAPDDRALDAVEDRASSLDTQLEARRRVAKLERALSTLSAVQRVAFVLRHVMGHSVEEVATMTGSARSTTRLRLYYARKAFAKAVGSMMADDLEDLTAEEK
jgi:RNA polymerase sigma factor (sigma-70 family)